MVKIIKEHWRMMLTCLIVFSSMFIFYTNVHPLYIYDVDDWTYIKSVREALPSLHQWNPTKILPETFFPLVSFLSSYILYPLNMDLIKSICIGSALFFATMITLYVYLTGKIITKTYKLPVTGICFILLVFFMAHFGAYLVADKNNYHVLYGGNVNGHYNYLLPALWNFILVLYFELNHTSKEWYEEKDYVKWSLMILLVYLAINSNLFHSLILMSYFGIELLFDLWEGSNTKKAKEQPSIKKFIICYVKRNFPKILALIVWFVSMIYEINGGRATWAGNIQEKLELIESIKMALKSLTMFNRYFMRAVTVINVVALIIAFVDAKKNDRAKDFILEQIKKFMMMLLVWGGLALVSAKVSPEYIKNPPVMISWVLYMIHITAMSMGYIMDRFTMTILIFPLVIYILLFSVVINRKTYVENYASSWGPSVVKALGDDMINQVVEAEKAGKISVTVYIPEKGSKGWPINPSMMQTRVASALYYNGVTDSLMEIILVPDANKNAEFHLR